MKSKENKWALTSFPGLKCSCICVCIYVWIYVYLFETEKSYFQLKIFITLCHFQMFGCDVELSIMCSEWLKTLQFFHSIEQTNATSCRGFSISNKIVWLFINQQFFNFNEEICWQIIILISNIWLNFLFKNCLIISQ